jgi:rhodanese-related sulfurtransferase
VKLISGVELKERIDRLDEVKLVFALGEQQYRAMHIPGSLNLPCSPSLFGPENDFGGLDPSDEIVVYCSGEGCYASISVYHLLVQRGYQNVSRYAGGLLDWMGAGYPLAGELAMSHAEIAPA